MLGWWQSSVLWLWLRLWLCGCQSQRRRNSSWRWRLWLEVRWRRQSCWCGTRTLSKPAESFRCHDNRSSRCVVVLLPQFWGGRRRGCDVFARRAATRDTWYNFYLHVWRKQTAFINRIVSFASRTHRDTHRIWCHDCGRLNLHNNAMLRDFLWRWRGRFSCQSLCFYCLFQIQRVILLLVWWRFGHVSFSLWPLNLMFLMASLMLNFLCGGFDVEVCFCVSFTGVKFSCEIFRWNTEFRSSTKHTKVIRDAWREHLGKQNSRPSSNEIAETKSWISPHMSWVLLGSFWSTDCCWEACKPLELIMRTKQWFGLLKWKLKDMPQDMPKIPTPMKHTHKQQEHPTIHFVEKDRRKQGRLFTWHQDENTTVTTLFLTSKYKWQYGTIYLSLSMEQLPNIHSRQSTRPIHIWRNKQTYCSINAMTDLDWKVVGCHANFFYLTPPNDWLIDSISKI